MSAASFRAAVRSFALVGTFAAGAWACTHLLPLEINGPTSGTFFIQVGEALDFHMQAVGPGSYVSPPAMNGSGLQFLSVTSGSANPGGVLQIFHFKGTAAGTTIITFSGGNVPGTNLAVVVDTVFVN